MECRYEEYSFTVTFLLGFRFWSTYLVAFLGLGSENFLFSCIFPSRNSRRCLPPVFCSVILFDAGTILFFFFFRNPEHIAEATVGTSWGMYFLVEHLGGQSMVKYVVKMKMKMVMKLGFYCFVRYVLCRVSG